MAHKSLCGMIRVGKLKISKSLKKAENGPFGENLFPITAYMSHIVFFFVRAVSVLINGLFFTTDDNDYETIRGEASDIEDNVELHYPPPLRQENPELPSTCTILKTRYGSKVYLVGTNHFSKESQEDVAKVTR